MSIAPNIKRKKCKVCKKTFQATKPTHVFCCRKCFKKDYWARLKKLQNEERAHPHFPVKICNFCGKTSTLDFDPLKLPQRFNLFECSFCHISNSMIWDYSNHPNSYQILTNLMAPVKANPYHSALVEGIFEITITKTPVLQTKIEVFKNTFKKL